MSKKFDSTKKCAVVGGGIGAGIGVLKGGSIGVAAFGGAVGVPLFVFLAGVGVVVGVGIKCLDDALDDKKYSKTYQRAINKRRRELYNAKLMLEYLENLAKV